MKDNYSIENNENKRAEKIVKVYNWTRYILMAIFIVLLYIGLKSAGA